MLIVVVEQEHRIGGFFDTYKQYHSHYPKSTKPRPNYNSNSGITQAMALAWNLAITLILLVLLQSCFLVTFASSNVHIVYMGNRSIDQSEQQSVEDSHLDILSRILGSKKVARKSILYSYKHGFSGFAAVLSQSQAKLIADFPGVVRVIPNKILSLHTTRSWDFLHLKEDIVTGALYRGQSGRGTIIGIMDTGIWPESESFRDEHMDNPPLHWRGICQGGENFDSSHCNRKIIGARWYIKGYEAEIGKLNTSDGVEYLSSRDASGHGTHTSSTAAGVAVENASFMGLAKGMARGGAPSAWLAIYKICWSTGGCSSADLLAAFDDAIFDGVHVLSASLGSDPPLPSYVEDALAIGSFHAVAKGISVVCSGGNSGPYPQTVINTAPWVITVAASTIDREFPSMITMGNNRTLQGQSLYTGKDLSKFYPIVYGEDIAVSDADQESASPGSLNATLAKGKAILCFQSRSQRSATVAIRTVTEVKGAGLIFAQFPTKDVDTSWTKPCVQVDYITGTTILSYIEATRNPVIKFSKTKTVVGQQISPEVAFFSSRGPSSLSPSVLKPDIGAPGVNILAAWSPASSAGLLSEANEDESRPLNFNIESGTSMACPHISAIVALVKAIHPTWSWSPAAIKSALVTTASLQNEYNQYIWAEGAPHKQADPFDYGGGHVDPNKVADPGLIYDLKNSDYVHFLCSMGYNNTAISLLTGFRTKCHESPKFLLNMNLPSITIPELKQPLTVSRTVTNVGPIKSIYNARVVAPIGVSVVVEPSTLTFSSTRKKMKFKVTFSSKLRVQSRFSFGYLFWEDGLHKVRIPLAVRSVVDEFCAQT
ncbi:subtilisin-like protease SBT3.5 isoform X2 [Cajanus cajan]|uniref:subtilisin-like protease SBT3.5 isoform X2 n=1 Tax=Cajanus cajan TaxID=3821 RepID=UPI00098DB5F5|nr:subtilisin-like protease SBT3.5 isoform X2 [Cajanus cajan]